MYSQYFGFKKPPFKITPDSGFFYTNAVFLDAHCSLLDAIDEQRGLSLLTGAAGTGKTTLLTRLAQDLDETVHFIYLQNSNLSLQDFIGSLLDKLGVIDVGQPRISIEAEIYRLRDHLKVLMEQERGCVLFIDDAQNLPHETLNALPLLLKSDDGSNQLQAVLSGSLELIDKLTDPALSAVSRMVGAQAQLDRLPSAEIASFIDHQIRVAGSMRSDIFSEGAIREIVQTTSGRPSDINKVCDKALEIAYRQKTQVVTREIIRQTSRSAWLEDETPAPSNTAGSNPFKQLAAKVSASAASGRPSVAAAVARVQSIGTVFSRSIRGLGRQLIRWSRITFEKFGVLALVALAKAWKYASRSASLIKSGGSSLFSGTQSQLEDKRPALRRRHAWIAGGLVLVAAFAASLAYLPTLDDGGKEQRVASATANSGAATASKQQSASKKSSGRNLTKLSELRRKVAQLSLDLKTTVSNRDYLKKLVGNLTEERNDLTLELSQLKFEHEQMQRTLDVTRKQVADLERDLSLARAPASGPDTGLRSVTGTNTLDLASNDSAQSGIATTVSDSDPSPKDQTLLQAAALEQSKSTDAHKTDGQAPLSQSSDADTPLPTSEQAGDVASAKLNPSTTGTSATDGSLDYIRDVSALSNDAAVASGQNTASSLEQVATTPAYIPLANEDPDTGQAGAEKAPKRTYSDRAVALLLHKARRLYLKDLLTTPAGNNAYDIYMQILDATPDHPKAAAGVKRIAARYLDWAETEENNGNRTKALRYYKKALAVVPDHMGIAERIEEIQSGRSKKTKVVEATPEVDSSEAARARLKTLGIEISERSLLRAVEARNLEITGLLIDAGISPDAQNVNKQTALLTAAINGDEATTKLLLERGADVNKPNSLGRSPLIAAAWNGDTRLISVLLAGGAEIEKTSEEGWNALMYAAWNGHRATVSALLEKGGRVDAINSQGWTALMNAAWNGHSATVQVLLEHGANAGYQTPSGETALLVASQQGHRATALLLD
ncbi:ankyrin repeat domain-containing protein [Pelagibius sp. Alg239-R121]|uniref:ankyrin repeat domain-containing protein n=1 Tax=Pelagibius sp. Alg239-R121 TaxID=2993448 RepID=UPI0024A6FFE8|nr:ankyrin repeat domain-containing protein [Pelagibius sp. Alg239-R121]